MPRRPVSSATFPVDYRAKLAAIMKATLADEAANQTWTYDEVRPMPVPPTWKPRQKVRGDCSKGVQYLDKWAGCPTDPMGEGWDDYGNSQTLWLKLQHLDTPDELLVGDDVTFGVDGADHAAKVIEAGSDPLLWSFGHEGAPNTYRLSEDGRVAQYLRVPLPEYVPTPDERCRARTGWFAWVAWRLGEGDWKNRGKANPAVRPNVPKLIPAGWWVRYAKFLANRKKGG